MPELAMRFLGHSCVRLELGGSVLLTDPVLTGRVGPLLRVGPVPGPPHWTDADLVLISHLHGDHLHLPSLRLLAGVGARIVVPRGAAGWVRARGLRRVDELAPGETLRHGALTITGVPAAHSGHRWGPRSTRGPQAVAMGHLIESAGLRVYAAGDTDLFDGMAALPRPDVALLPVWGWGPTLGPGHLDPERAARAVRLIRPRIAVPVHWGSLALAGLVRAPGRAGARMRDRLVDPPHEFAAAVAAGVAGVGADAAAVGAASGVGGSGVPGAETVGVGTGVGGSGVAGAETVGAGAVGAGAVGAGAIGSGARAVTTEVLVTPVGEPVAWSARTSP